MYAIILRGNVAYGWLETTLAQSAEFECDFVLKDTLPAEFTGLPTGCYVSYDRVADKFSVVNPMPAPPPPTLADVKSSKLAQLQTARDNAIYTTFTSSALGTVKTYSYSKEAADNFRGKALMLSLNPNIASVSWYTIEDAAFVTHTRAQFIQVCTDGDSHEEPLKMRYFTKEAQVNVATTTAAVNTVGWPNPAPPSVPTGLAGTAGAAGSGQVTLTWTANTDVTMLGGGGYNVYDDSGTKAVNTSLVTGTTFTVTGLAVGSHTFAITAVDTDGNESAKCAAITVTVS